jgi:hypothetical protein
METMMWMKFSALGAESAADVLPGLLTCSWCC